MPEGLEVEIWRRASAPLVGRRIERAWVDDRVAPDGFADEVERARIGSVSRRGKVLLLGLEDGPVIGLHFGMTGRLVVDGSAAIERLAYASGADRAEWDRLRIWSGDGRCVEPALRMNDPRRLGRVSLDPDLSELGPEASTLTGARLRSAIGRRRSPIKSVLLNQHVVAGLGNLCVDEVLFDAGVAPHRTVDDLSAEEIDRLARSCRRRLAEMLALGGSTHGVLDPHRRASLDTCPLDGSPLRRSTIGGRTTIWCPAHQA